MRKFVCTPWAIKGLVVATLVTGLPGTSYAQSADEDLRLETDVDDTTDVSPPAGPISRITVEDDEAPAPRRRRRVVEDAYTATGLDLGAFQFFPTLEIGTVTTSNVGRNAKGDADIGFRLKPGFRLESDWVRHQLNFAGSADVLRYLENEDLAANAGSLDSSFRLDIRRDTRADFTLNYGLTSTGAESTEVPDTATGGRMDQTLSASAALTHDLGPLESTFKLGLTRNMFGDVSLTGGGTEDNSDRDYTEISASLRGSLKTGGLLQPFAEVAYEPRLHDKSKDRAGIKRNSQGLRIAAGVALNDDPIWSGEIGVTAQLRDYEDNSLATAFAPGVTASINWRPTDLTRFEFNSGISLAETVAAGSSATRSWTGGFTATHALRENLDVIAGLAFNYDDSDAGNSLSTSARLGLAWDVNPYLSLTAGYQGTWVNGVTSAGDYNEQQVLTSIILKR
jgi:hypothetical protein